MFVLWQMVHYIIPNVPCAKLLISIERTLIHFIVILNRVYSAWISNIYTNIVKDTTSHDSGGDSACFFLQWFIETPPTSFQIPKACSITTRAWLRARFKHNWLSVNVGVCLNRFISQTDKGYAESPTRRGPTSEPPILFEGLFSQVPWSISLSSLLKRRIRASWMLPG